MNATDDILKTALEYYDTNHEKYKHMFENVNYVKFDNDPSDMGNSKLVMLDDDKNEIRTVKYELIGTYDHTYRVWIWAWSIPSLGKNLSYKSRRILSYGMDLEYKRYPFLKFELITSRFVVTDPIQLDMYTAVASYIAKHRIIFKIKVKNNFDGSGIRLIKDEMDNEDTHSYYLFIYLDENNN